MDLCSRYPCVVVEGFYAVVRPLAGLVMDLGKVQVSGADLNNCLYIELFLLRSIVFVLLIVHICYPYSFYR